MKVFEEVARPVRWHLIGVVTGAGAFAVALSALVAAVVIL